MFSAFIERSHDFFNIFNLVYVHACATEHTWRSYGIWFFHLGGPREPTECLYPLLHLGGALVDFQLLTAMAYYNKSCLAKEHIVCVCVCNLIVLFLDEDTDDNMHIYYRLWLLSYLSWRLVLPCSAPLGPSALTVRH